MDFPNMTKEKSIREKLEYLQELVIDKYISDLESDEIYAKDLAPVMTLLSQNKVAAPTDDEEGTHSKVKRIMKSEKK